MFRGVLLLLVILSFPLSAAAIEGGFPSKNLWLSSTSARAGEEIKIYTLVYDSADTDISGTVTFYGDGTSVGTAPFSLKPGQSAIVSISWKPTEGVHSVSARITNAKNASGENITLFDTTGNVSIVIAAALPPTPLASAVNTVQTTASQATPIVISTASQAANSAESVRLAAVSAIENAIKQSAAPTQHAGNTGSLTGGSMGGGSETQLAGSVLGASDERSDFEAIEGTASVGSVAGQAWQGFLHGLLYVAKIQWLFYLALLILAYILYKIVRTFFRERKHPAF